MRKMKFDKYKAYPTVPLKDRQWPDKTLTSAPIWCSVDLRDGNQALSEPMSVEQKIKLFKMLVDIGFKEIEIGFPSASETEFNFLRTLVDKNMIPQDVTIQVLTQAREHLINKTFEALKGVQTAIVHMYNPTSTIQRKAVFRKEKKEIIDIALKGVEIIKNCKEKIKGTKIYLQYSPESYTETENDFAVEISNKVINAWQPDKDNKIIINLPATVEMSTPNIYADRIEWFSKNVVQRENVIISLHTHNDRGTAVAAAELGLLAGADRIEGALFGNGERSGNMDLVIIALNMFSRGIDPRLDFNDINPISSIYKETTGMEIHPRHPYAGELVYTAFSGSHQDAINKGMKYREETNSYIWDVPYLPIDPKDVGRSYEAIIRINSQSGKGGISYIMEKEYGIIIPKWMQPRFSKIIQKITDDSGKEINSKIIHDAFYNNYINYSDGIKLVKSRISSKEMEVNGKKSNNNTIVTAIVKKGIREFEIKSKGNGPVNAFVKGLKEQLNLDFSLNNYSEHAVISGSDSKAIAYIEILTGDKKSLCGAGIDSNISIASIKAVLSALSELI